jgi:hypothetical protein
VGTDCSYDISGYQLVYDLNIPASLGGNRWQNSVPYTTDNSASVSMGTRVAYALELDDHYVWAEMDDFTGGIPAHTGVPIQWWFEQGGRHNPVTNLTIRDNAATTTASGISEVTNDATGSIQFWPNCYSQDTSTNRFDTNDVESNAGTLSPCYGAMQVSRGTTTQFAFNRWESGGVTATDLGIGNSTVTGSAPSTDWTFDTNSGSYGRRRLRVFVSGLPVTAGLVSHYDSRAGTSVVLGSGTSVAQWNDLSGNAYNLTPWSGTPVLTSSLIHGFPAIDFTASGLEGGGVPLANQASITVFVVMQNRTPDGWGAVVHHGSRDNDWSMEQNNNVGGNDFHFQSVNDNAACDLPLTTGTNYVLTGRITGTTRYFSSTTLGSTASTTCSGNSIAPANLNFYVGASDNNEHSNAYIGEIVYFNRSLSDAERDLMIGYLGTRWGI